MNNQAPYQQASEELRNRSARPVEFAKKGLYAGAGLIGGSSVFSKIMPFLNKYIPQDLAKKGLNKIDSRLGDFVNHAINAGYDFNDVSEFIKKKAQSEGTKTPEQTNIIKQYSDKLHAFLDDQIKKGRPVLEAGAIAQSNPEYSKVIKKLEKDHKANWSSILQSVYGAGQEPTQQQSIQGQMQPNQKGGNDQALLSAIERILQM